MSKSLTKTQMIKQVARKTGLKSKEVKEIFTATKDVIQDEIKSHRPVKLFDVVKIAVKHKNATAERKGNNPFTGEQTTFKAKPAKDVVKVKPLKQLKHCMESPT